MLVEELDVAIIDALRNLLSNLMRRPPLNHIQPRPSILRLRTRGRADEKIVLELPLEVVLLDMVCQGRGDFPDTAALVFACSQPTS